jgi:hypothetical protein
MFIKCNITILLFTRLICTYPDSVNRVKPPHITIPNTLAALPKSQYATFLSLVFGNADFLTTACDAACTPFLKLVTCCGACVV